ncbi:DUF2513 domain-containing protein [Methylomonas sp. MED-D]|uniref:DUF2513 domain-containing protein n=1 Tax=Methylomonas sp. MED-D TaxID=3418768 RepID=UPI003D0791B8
MKRDYDLIRLILLAAESDAPQTFPNYDAETVGHHIYLLWQAGLVEAIDTSLASGRHKLASYPRLTWHGHEFLDQIRDDGIWQNAKTHVIKPGAGLAFDLLTAWLKQEAASRLGLNL